MRIMRRPCGRAAVRPAPARGCAVPVANIIGNTCPYTDQGPIVVEVESARVPVRNGDIGISGEKLTRRGVGSNIVSGRIEACDCSDAGVPTAWTANG